MTVIHISHQKLFLYLLVPNFKCQGYTNISTGMLKFKRWLFILNKVVELCLSQSEACECCNTTCTIPSNTTVSKAIKAINSIHPPFHQHSTQKAFASHFFIIRVLRTALLKKDGGPCRVLTLYLLSFPGCEASHTIWALQKSTCTGIYTQMKKLDLKRAIT